MKSKRSLMTMLVGLAMLATPLTAAAKDHHFYDSHSSHAGRAFAPAVVNRHEFRNGGNATWMPAPAPSTRHEWRDGHWGDANDYRNYGRGYGNPGYYGAPAYAAPVYAAPVATPYYGGGYGGGNGCANAQRVMNTYYRDRNTGHPAAAYDLLRQNQWAFRSGCASGAPVGGGLLGGLGGLGGFGGVPAYNNYGGYNGYNSGYNGGYGQPYGGTSMLAPLLQQFIR